MAFVLFFIATSPRTETKKGPPSHDTTEPAAAAAVPHPADCDQYRNRSLEGSLRLLAHLHHRPETHFLVSAAVLRLTRAHPVACRGNFPTSRSHALSQILACFRPRTMQRFYQRDKDGKKTFQSRQTLVVSRGTQTHLTIC